MRRIYSSIFISISIFTILCCHDKEDPCNCQTDETCIYNAVIDSNECYLSEWVHYLGGIRIIALNSYVGVATNCQCLDTLIFYNDTTRAFENERFGLIVNVPPGTQDVMGSSPPFQASDNEFYSSSVTPLCYLNGEGWYANLHFKIEPDSVWMKLGFWTLNSPPGVLIDSCEVRFYKTK